MYEGCVIVGQELLFSEKVNTIAEFFMIFELRQ